MSATQCVIRACERNGAIAHHCALLIIEELHDRAHVAQHALIVEICMDG